MIEEFIKELSYRVSVISPNPEQLEFSLYVRLMREKLNIDRTTLAKKTGLEKQFLTFLEYQLLDQKEVTEDDRKQIEVAFGVPFQSFKRFNQTILDELRPDWEKLVFRCPKDEQTDKETAIIT
jgi:hypothetical protein